MEIKKFKIDKETGKEIWEPIKLQISIRNGKQWKELENKIMKKNDKQWKDFT